MGVDPRRRALLSVSDKTGLADFARGLSERGYELVSTGGTARTIRDAGVAVIDVATVTGAPEMLDGRVKTLHPRIHAGVLADLTDPSHREQLAEHGIEPFSLVVVNLYPFEAAADRGDSNEDLIEEIDIGGPTLVRAAAKNHASVAIVTDPADYPAILEELDTDGGIGEASRRMLALRAFERTAAYDAAISTELASRWTDDDTQLPPRLDLRLIREQSLRYGENPHQAAALYRVAGANPATGPFARGVVQLQGKPLSYNNLLDASAVAAIGRDMRAPAVAIVKHSNPCGAAEAHDLQSAWERALAGDPVSAFGGVVVVRGTVTGSLADALTSLFLEVVVADDYSEEARTVLAAKPDLRLLVDETLTHGPVASQDVRSAGGAVLVTDADVMPDDPSEWRSVSQRDATATERTDLDFAWRMARHVKSNAIVLVRDGAIIGVGAGQMSRVQSARIAIEHAGDRAEGAVCASDAFFPFADGVQVCLDGGVTAVIEPGGSKRDADVVAAVDEAEGALVFTATRHFRH